MMPGHAAAVGVLVGLRALTSGRGSASAVPRRQTPGVESVQVAAAGAGGRGTVVIKSAYAARVASVSVAPAVFLFLTFRE